MSKYTYPAGMTEAQKKTLRRKQRELDKTSGTFVPYGGQVTLSDSLLTTTVPRTSQGTSRTSTVTSVNSPYAVRTVKDFLTLCSTGVDIQALARVTDPTVLKEYIALRDLMALAHAGQTSDDDDQSDDDDDDQQDQSDDQGTSDSD